MRAETRIVVRSRITRWPHCTVEKGETGRVVAVDPETSDLLIKLDADYPELDCWNGLLPLSRPFLHHIRPARPELVTKFDLRQALERQTLRLTMRIAVMIAGFVLVGFVLMGG